MQFRKILFAILAVLIATGLLYSLSAEASAQGNTIYVIEINGDIDAGTAHYVSNAISRAEKDNAPLLIKLNTPGGLLKPTKDIVDQMLTSRTTVVCWVTPKGAWAYSAGTYILLASDVAAMDNATGIGAAEPRPHDNKIVSAMINWIEEIAKSQGRPSQIAKEFVTKNRTIRTEDVRKENLIEENLVDLIATSEKKILDRLDRSQAQKEELGKSLTSNLLGVLSNPRVALILLIAGMLGIAAEITTGGVGVPGVAGGICLLLSFFGLRVLEVSELGLALTVLGVVLLAAEVFEPGFGAFGIGGGITLFLGVLFIGEEPWVEVSGMLVKGIVIALIAIFGAFIWIVRRTKGKEAKTGMESMVDSTGTATKDIDPDGVVRVRGERWAATSDERIEEGEEILVKDIIKKEGLTTLVVEKYSGG